MLYVTISTHQKGIMQHVAVANTSINSVIRPCSENYNSI